MTQKINTLEELLQKLEALSGEIVVLGHARPDPDAVGAAVGLAAFLRAKSKIAWAMSPHPLDKGLRFMVEGLDFWHEPDGNFLKGKTVVAVDSASLNLFEGFIDEKTSVVLAIDHHLSHKPYAVDYYLDAPATSTSAIISTLFSKAGVIPTQKVADALYGGVICDTGMFAWGGVTEKTFQVAEFLAKSGAEVEMLADELFIQKSRPHILLLQRMLDRMEFLFDGGAVFSWLTKKDFDEIRAAREDKEGLVSYMRNIRGVKMAVLINDEGDSLGISTRARDRTMRVDKLCENWGGGGHAAAAAVRGGIKMSLQDFLPRLRTALEVHWKAYGQAS